MIRYINLHPTLSIRSLFYLCSGWYSWICNQSTLNRSHEIYANYELQIPLRSRTKFRPSDISRSNVLLERCGFVLTIQHCKTAIENAKKFFGPATFGSDCTPFITLWQLQKLMVLPYVTISMLKLTNFPVNCYDWIKENEWVIFTKKPSG